MFGINRKLFIVLLASIVNASNHTKCVSLSNQKREIQPTFINLHPNEYSQELHYNPFPVKLDPFAGSSNTLNDLFNNVCLPNKTKDLSIHLFNMITLTGKNESKILIKDTSCKCKFKFDGRKCNSS